MNIIKKAQDGEPRRPPPPMPKSPAETVTPTTVTKPTAIVKEEGAGEGRKPPPKQEAEDPKSVLAPKSKPAASNLIPHSISVEKMQREMGYIRTEFRKLMSESSVKGGIVDRHLKAKDDQELINKIESIKTIGKINTIGGKQVSEPDGLWGGKTTTALNNIVDIANMMLSISTKFNSPLRFKQEDVGLITSQINIQSKAPKELATINSCAETINPILENIVGSIDSFIKILKSTEENKDLQSKEVNYLALKIDEESLKQFEHVYLSQILGKDIPVINLLDPRLFNDTLKNLGINKDSDSINKFLDSILEEITNNKILVNTTAEKMGF